MNKIKILERLKADFEDIPINCRLIDDREFSPDPALVCENPHIGAFGHDAISQYFFVDYEIAASNTDYFNCVIVLDDDISTERLDDVFRAVSYLNYYIPYGCFVLGDDNELMYKLGVPVDSDMPDDAAFDYINKISAHALDCFRRNIAMITDVAEGKLTPADIVEIFGGESEEE